MTTVTIPPCTGRARTLRALYDNTGHPYYYLVLSAGQEEHVLLQATDKITGLVVELPGTINGDIPGGAVAVPWFDVLRAKATNLPIHIEIDEPALRISTRLGNSLPTTQRLRYGPALPDARRLAGVVESKAEARLSVRSTALREAVLAASASASSVSPAGRFIVCSSEDSKLVAAPLWHAEDRHYAPATVLEGRLPATRLNPALLERLLRHTGDQDLDVFFWKDGMPLLIRAVRYRWTFLIAPGTS